jgi:hypothetical protein
VNTPRHHWLVLRISAAGNTNELIHQPSYSLKQLNM